MRLEADWIGDDGSREFEHEEKVIHKRCENCGKGINLDLDEYGKTEEGDFLCWDCWLADIELLKREAEEINNEK